MQFGGLITLSDFLIEFGIFGLGNSTLCFLFFVRFFAFSCVEYLVRAQWWPLLELNGGREEKVIFVFLSFSFSFSFPFSFFFFIFFFFYEFLVGAAPFFVC